MRCSVQSAVPWNQECAPTNTSHGSGGRSYLRPVVGKVTETLRFSVTAPSSCKWQVVELVAEPCSDYKACVLSMGRHFLPEFICWRKCNGTFRIEE